MEKIELKIKVEILKESIDLLSKEMEILGVNNLFELKERNLELGFKTYEELITSDGSNKKTTQKIIFSVYITDIKNP